MILKLFLFLTIFSAQLSWAESFSIELDANIRLALSEEAYAAYAKSKFLRSSLHRIVKSGHCDPYPGDYRSNMALNYYYGCIIRNKSGDLIVFSKENGNEPLIGKSDATLSTYEVEILSPELIEFIESKTFSQLLIKILRVGPDGQKLSSAPKLLRKWSRVIIIGKKEILPPD